MKKSNSVWDSVRLTNTCRRLLPFNWWMDRSSVDMFIFFACNVMFDAFSTTFTYQNSCKIWNHHHFITVASQKRQKIYSYLYIVLCTWYKNQCNWPFKFYATISLSATVSFFIAKSEWFLFIKSANQMRAQNELLWANIREQKNIIEQRRGGEDTKNTNENGKNQVWSIRNNKFSCHLTHLFVCVWGFP